MACFFKTVPTVLLTALWSLGRPDTSTNGISYIYRLYSMSDSILGWPVSPDRVERLL